VPWRLAGGEAALCLHAQGDPGMASGARPDRLGRLERLHVRVESAPASGCEAAVGGPDTLERLRERPAAVQSLEIRGAVLRADPDHDAVAEPERRGAAERSLLADRAVEGRLIHLASIMHAPSPAVCANPVTRCNNEGA